MGTGYFTPHRLHHHHALRRRLRIHRPHCPGKKESSHVTSLRANKNRLFNHVTSPSLSRSTEAAAYSSSSLPRYLETGYFNPHCLHHHHALWRRLRIHCSHYPGIAVTWHTKDHWKQVILLPTVSITITLYGGGCVFIVLIARVKQSRDSLRANNNRLLNHVTSPSPSRSTETAASSLSSFLR